MGLLVAAVNVPWHGHGWNFPALSALAALTVVATTLATRRLARI
jgi:hypothetical protein